MSKVYETPLTYRYASAYMSNLFSSDVRYKTWRKLWISLARAEKKCGLNITDEQIRDLEENVDNIDFDRVKQIESEIHHDVMAHIRAYGEVAKIAEPIIHLGATSCYVTDNTDLILYKSALTYIKETLKSEILILIEFAEKYKSLPTIGYTHYQVAQPVTVGKRACIWLQDFYIAYKQIDYVIKNMKFLGCRGTTGTEASFIELFDGDTKKIDEMNKMIANDFGFDELFDISGQTYTRLHDSIIMNALSIISQAAYKMANDIRLLAHDKQIEEPFSKNQVGSSAMAYKRNPMLCERICSLARYVIVDSMNPALTEMVQWFERTLDDSANRRMSIPEGFLAVDSIIELLKKVTDGLVVNDLIIKKEVDKYLPFIATENILMESVKRGESRQVVHEIIRKCSIECINKMKSGIEFNLPYELSKHSEIGMTESEINNLLKPELYIGRCIEQVENFTKKLKEEL